MLALMKPTHAHTLAHTKSMLAETVVRKTAPHESL